LVPAGFRPYEYIDNTVEGWDPTLQLKLLVFVVTHVAQLQNSFDIVEFKEIYIVT